MIEATDAFKRFANGRSWQQLDFQTQQTVRYFAILEQVASKYGLELAQNTSSRQAAFVAQLKNAQLALGQAFLPIYNVVLPALTRMATALANAAQYLAAFTQALFGYNNAQQAKAVEQQAGAVSDLGDAYDEAGKKAKGAVAGFDEVNLVGGTTPEAGAVGGLAPVADGTDISAFDKAADGMDNVATKAAEMAAKVKNAYRQLSDFIREHSAIITSALAGVGAAFVTHFVVTNWATIIGGVTNALKALRTALTTTWTAALGPVGLVVAAIGAATAAAVYFYQTNEQFRGVVDGIFSQIGQAAQWLWERVFKPFGDWIASTWPVVWDGVGQVVQWVWDNTLKPFGEWLQKVMPIAWQAVSDAAKWLWQNILKPFGEFLLWIWHNVIVPVAEVLADILGTAFKFVADVAESFWRNVLIPLSQALSEMLAPAVEAVSAVLTFLWENVLKPFATFLGGLIKGVLTELIKIFRVLWQDVLKPLATFVGGTFKIVFENTFEAIGGVINGLKQAFIGLMDFIAGVFTGNWRRAWEGVRDTFKGIMESLWAIVKYPLNLIIDGINAVIGGLNKLSIKIPDWVPGFGGETWGINIPKIPKLDVGTNYVKREGLAYLHEGEAVVPKKYNPAAGGGVTEAQWNEIIKLLRGILEATREGKNIVIPGSMLTKAVVQGIRDQTRRTGVNPLAGTF